MLQIISPLSTTTTTLGLCFACFFLHMFLFFIQFRFNRDAYILVKSSMHCDIVILGVVLHWSMRSPLAKMLLSFSFFILHHFKWPIVCNAITVLFDSFSAIKSACAYKNTMVNYKCVFLCFIIIIMELRIKWSNVL